AEGELVLAALGGDSSPCLDLIRAWGGHSDDLTVLAVGPRSASDPLAFPAAVVDHAETLGLSGHAAVSMGGSVSSGHVSAMSYAHRQGRARRIARYGSSLGSRGGGRFLGKRPLARPVPASLVSLVRHGALRRGQMLGAADGDFRTRIELIRLLALGTP